MTWFLLVLIFRSGVLVDYNVFFGTSEAECREAKDLALATPVRPPLALWGECFEIKRDVKPQVHPKGVPGTEQRS